MGYEELRVPSFCPICRRYMTGVRSTITYYDFGCCRDCWVQWVDTREERWKAGWRPTPEQVELFREEIKGHPV